MLPPNKFKTLKQLITKFNSELACHQYLAGQRWNGLMECPHAGCNGEQAYIFSDGIRYKCKCCKRLYTAKTGTIFEGTKLPLQDWFIAIYLVMHKKGISSIQLGKDLGVTQKTAWFMLCRIRKVLGNAPTELVDGVVEIDETFVGGLARFKHRNKRPKYLKEAGRDLPGKTAVMGVLQRGGRLQAMVIKDTLAKTLYYVVKQHIDRSATLMTDGYSGYHMFNTLYECHSTDHGRGFYADGDNHTNTIEGFWSQFKKGIKGVYHQATPRHLQKYVDEFVFKYNYRKLPIDQQFDIIIDQMNCRLKYSQLIRRAA